METQLQKLDKIDSLLLGLCSKQPDPDKETIVNSGQSCRLLSDGTYQYNNWYDTYDGTSIVRKYTTVSGTLNDIDPFSFLPADGSVVSYHADCASLNEPLTKEISEGDSLTTFIAPYHSLTVTALSNDVTIDGVNIPQGLTWSVDSNKGEQFANDTIVDGTQFITTIVK